MSLFAETTMEAPLWIQWKGGWQILVIVEFGGEVSHINLRDITDSHLSSCRWEDEYLDRQ